MEKLKSVSFLLSKVVSLETSVQSTFNLCTGKLLFNQLCRRSKAARTPSVARLQLSVDRIVFNIKLQNFTFEGVFVVVLEKKETGELH